MHASLQGVHCTNLSHTYLEGLQVLVFLTSVHYEEEDGWSHARALEMMVGEEAGEILSESSNTLCIPVAGTQWWRSER